MASLPQPLVLEWVAQSTQSQALVNRLMSSDFLILQSGITPLPTGAVRYYFIVQPLSSSVNRGEIIKQAQQISNLALTFTFNMVNVSLLQQRQYAQGLEDILMAYLSCRYHLEVAEMEHIYLSNPNTLILKPLSRTGLSFYMTEEERRALLSEDYEVLVGYDLLSSDPLIWFYLNKEKTESDRGLGQPGDPRSQWYVRSWHGMAIFPIIPPPEEEGIGDAGGSKIHLPTSSVAQFRDFFVEAEDIEDMSTPFGIWWTDRDIFRNEVNLFVSSLRLENYFILHLSEDIIDLAKELARMWEINYYGAFSIYPRPGEKATSEEGLIRDQPQSSKMTHVFAPTKTLGLDVATWFQDALLRVRLGYLPIFYIGGDWVQYVEPLIENMARLQYAAIRAYYQVSQTNNAVLEEHVWEVKCLPNLLIAAPFSALSEVIAFENLFRSYLPETRNWQVIECPDLETCTRRRLAIIQEDPSLRPLGITVPAEPGTIYLVLDTSLGQGTITPQIGNINPEQANGLSEATQRGIAITKRHEISLKGDLNITYHYIPKNKATYSFYLDEELVMNPTRPPISELHLMTVETEDPVSIYKGMSNAKEDLLSPWGESYYKYHPEVALRRDHFLPSRLLRKKFC